MKLNKLTCDSCGNPLDFSNKDKLVICKYCGCTYSIEYDDTQVPPHVKTEYSSFPYVLRKINIKQEKALRRLKKLNQTSNILLPVLIAIFGGLLIITMLLRNCNTPGPIISNEQATPASSEETIILPTNTPVTTSTPSPLPSPSIEVDNTPTLSLTSITNLGSIGESPRLTDRLTDNYGNTYKEAVINNHGYNGSAGPIAYEYLTNGKFHYLKGTIYVPEGESDDGTSTLVVKGDGHTLFTSAPFDKRSHPLPFEVNVVGLNAIEIEWSNNSGYSNISSLDCCLGEAYFVFDEQYESLNEAQEKLPYSILDLYSVYTNVSLSQRLTDNYGNRYSNAIYNRVDNSHNNNVPIYEYILNKEFKQLTGTIYVPEGLSFKNPVHLLIYADDIAVYTSPAFTCESAPVNIDVNVSEVENLKITFTESSWYDSALDQTICLANVFLFP